MSAIRDNECRRKDKRLLVLLAFGAIVLAINLWQPHHVVNAPRQQMWVELHGDRAGLYRMTELEQLYQVRQDNQSRNNIFSSEQRLSAYIQASWEKQDSIVSLKKNEAGVYQPVGVSPEVSYFLKQRVPINRADTTSLELVPGIGPYLAGNIVDYRKKVGRINDKHELTAIPGIGESRSKKLAPFFSFE